MRLVESLPVKTQSAAGGHCMWPLKASLSTESSITGHLLCVELAGLIFCTLERCMPGGAIATSERKGCHITICERSSPQIYE